MYCSLKLPHELRYYVQVVESPMKIVKIEFEENNNI